MKFLRPFSRLRLDIRGTTAVEFALLAVPFFGFVCAIFEIGYVHFQTEALSGAVEQAARAMLTGKTQTSGTVQTSQQFVTSFLCPALQKVSATMTCANLIVDVRPAANFVAGNMSNDLYNSQSNEFCPGKPGQVVVMRVAYPLPSIFPLALLGGNVGTVNNVPGMSGNFHILMGEAAFMEENYSGSYTTPPGC